VITQGKGSKAETDIVEGFYNKISMSLLMSNCAEK